MKNQINIASGTNIAIFNNNNFNFIIFLSEFYGEVAGI